MWKCFKTVIVKVFHSDNLKRVAKWSMWKCFKTFIVKVFQSDNLKKEKQSDQCGNVSVIVEVFHSDNLKKGSKVINVEMFQNSHCQSVSQWQPEKG